MKLSIRTAALGVAAAAMLAVSMPAPANATHQIGHFAAGVGLGLLLGGGLYNQRQPVYQVQPVYQPQLICHWEKKQIYDPYLGAYIWQNQKVCIQG